MFASNNTGLVPHKRLRTMTLRNILFFSFGVSLSVLLLWIGGSTSPRALAQPAPDASAGEPADAPGLPPDEPDLPPDEPDLPDEEPDLREEPVPPTPEVQPPPQESPAPLRPNIGTKPYLTVEVHEDLRRERNNVMAMLRNRKFEGEEEEKVFEAYYRQYFLPRWTQPEHLASLPLFRRELRNNLQVARSGPPHSRLQQVVIDYLGRMASANVHPAARVNAMLMIGELNEEEPVRAGDAPTPLPATLPVLLKTLDDDRQIDPVKVAALVGIVRHAQFGQRTPESTAAIQRAMIRLANSPGAPARSAEGHAWMRAQAARTLGLLGSVGENAAVARLLAALVADDQLEMLVRCHAAAALGQLNYAGAAGLNVAQVVAALGRLAADAVRADTDSFDDTPDSFSRRRLKARLVAVQHGLVGDDEERVRGIGEVVGGGEQQAFNAVRSEVEKLLALFDSKLDDDQLVESLRASLANLGPARRPETAQTGR